MRGGGAPAAVVIAALVISGCGRDEGETEAPAPLGPVALLWPASFRPAEAWDPVRHIALSVTDYKPDEEGGIGPWYAVKGLDQAEYAPVIALVDAGAMEVRMLQAPPTILSAKLAPPLVLDDGAFVLVGTRVDYPSFRDRTHQMFDQGAKFASYLEDRVLTDREADAIMRPFEDMQTAMLEDQFLWVASASERRGELIRIASSAEEWYDDTVQLPSGRPGIDAAFGADGLVSPFTLDRETGSFRVGDPIHERRGLSVVKLINEDSIYARGSCVLIREDGSSIPVPSRGGYVAHAISPDRTVETAWEPGDAASKVSMFTAELDAEPAVTFEVPGGLHTARIVEPNGDRVLVSTDEGLYVCDPATGEVDRVGPGGAPVIRRSRVIPGRYFGISENQRIIVVNLGEDAPSSQTIDLSKLISVPAD